MNMGKTKNIKIPIRNRELPKSPRVFDVTVDEVGHILRYDMQNIRGSAYVSSEDVNRQIQEYLAKKIS